MKKRIIGRTYDTEISYRIGDYVKNPLCPDKPDNPQYWEAALYITPRERRPFLHGKGGELSLFGSHIGNKVWTSGEKIIPLRLDVATKWAKRFIDDADALLKVFHNGKKD